MLKRESIKEEKMESFNAETIRVDEIKDFAKRVKVDQSSVKRVT